MIMLMGLVTKNAILLIDYTITLGARYGSGGGASQGWSGPAPADRHDDGRDGLRHAAYGI